MAERLLAGDRATLARAITMVESRSPKWQAVGQGLVSAAINAQKTSGPNGGKCLQMICSEPVGIGADVACALAGWYGQTTVGAYSLCGDASHPA